MPRLTRSKRCGWRSARDVSLLTIATITLVPKVGFPARCWRIGDCDKEGSALPGRCRRVAFEGVDHTQACSDPGTRTRVPGCVEAERNGSERYCRPDSPPASTQQRASRSRRTFPSARRRPTPRATDQTRLVLGDLSVWRIDRRYKMTGRFALQARAASRRGRISLTLK
jgi:hypothetical protein